MEKYFFDDGRTCWGPVKASRIVELYDEGILSSQSPIRLCGSPEWKKLEDMEILFKACREAKEQRNPAPQRKSLFLRRWLSGIFPSQRKVETLKTQK